MHTKNFMAKLKYAGMRRRTEARKFHSGFIMFIADLSKANIFKKNIVKLFFTVFFLEKLKLRIN